MSDPQLIIGTETLYIHVSLNDHSESVTLGFPFTVCSYSEMYRSPEGKRESFLFSCDPKKNNWLQFSSEETKWRRFHVRKKNSQDLLFFSFCGDISSLGFTDVKTSSVFPSLKQWKQMFHSSVFLMCNCVKKTHDFFLLSLTERKKKCFLFEIK